MTDAQLRRLYHPAWRRAAARWWKESRGVATRTGQVPLALADSLGQLLDEIEDLATVCAAKRGAEQWDLRDLRYGCHGRALTAFRPSKALTNRDLDRVLALWRVLEDPDDVGAWLDWENPERADRRRLEYLVPRLAPAEYTAAIVRDLGASHWSDLDDGALRKLVMTLGNRSRAASVQRRGSPVA
jgi:hypothetical protein